MGCEKSNFIYFLELNVIIKYKCIKFLNFATLHTFPMGFKEHKQLKLSAVSQEILSYWEEASIFEKSITSREGQTPFVFYQYCRQVNQKSLVHLR